MSTTTRHRKKAYFRTVNRKVFLFSFFSRLYTSHHRNGIHSQRSSIIEKMFSFSQCGIKNLTIIQQNRSIRQFARLDVVLIYEPQHRQDRSIYI